MQGVGRGRPPPGFEPLSGVERGASTGVTTTTSSKKKKKKSAAQPTHYVPGLTARPVSPPTEATAKSNTKDVPATLIEAFLNGTKNPVSAVMEYCSMQRRTAKFQEVSVEVPSYSATFACQCSIDGTKFPQGTGRTKKEAKTNSAKIAFTQILGLEEDDVDDDGINQIGIAEVSQDHAGFGRDRVGGLTKYGDFTEVKNAVVVGRESAPHPVSSKSSVTSRDFCNADLVY